MGFSTMSKNTRRTKKEKTKIRVPKEVILRRLRNWTLGTMFLSTSVTLLYRNLWESVIIGVCMGGLAFTIVHDLHFREKK